jgi:hypothetical protein
VLSTLSRSAVAGLTKTALSHVSLLRGFGSSWSQPLLAKRPSRIDGSLRNEISKPPAPATSAVARISPIAARRTVTAFAGSAVFGTTPSCSQRRHCRSNSGLIFTAPVGGVRPETPPVD